MSRQVCNQLHYERRLAALPAHQMARLLGRLGRVRKFILFSVITTEMPVMFHRAKSPVGTARSLKTRPSRIRKDSSNTRSRISGGSNNRPNFFSKERALR